MFLKKSQEGRLSKTKDGVLYNGKFYKNSEIEKMSYVKRPWEQEAINNGKKLKEILIKL